MDHLVVNVKTAVTSRISSNKSKEETSNDARGSNFSVMALQTIGGSSVPSKKPDQGSAQGVDSKGVKVQRSWRVESSSRSIIFGLDDAESDEEHILSGRVVAEMDRDIARQG